MFHQDTEQPTADFNFRAQRKEKKEEQKRHNKFRYRYQITAYLMLLPAFALITIFVIIPLIMAIVHSFQDYTTGSFVGFYNYRYILQTPQFTKACLNVLIFTVIITFLMMVLSFGFALVLKALRSRLSKEVRTLIYLPFFISGVVAAIVFQMIINYGGGLISSILISLDLDPISFTTEGLWPYICIIVPTIWLGFGYNTLVMYAGLINIPKEYYEAALIDGANSLKRVVYITLPNMRNYFVLIAINLVTVNMQMMEVPYMITEGGPLNATLTPVLYLFNSFRDPSRPENVTTAGALLIMVFIMVINVVVFKLMRSNKNADL